MMSWLRPANRSAFERRNVGRPVRREHRRAVPAVRIYALDPMEASRCKPALSRRCNWRVTSGFLRREQFRNAEPASHVLVHDRRLCRSIRMTSATRLVSAPSVFSGRPVSSNDLQAGVARAVIPRRDVALDLEPGFEPSRRALIRSRTISDNRLDFAKVTRLCRSRRARSARLGPVSAPAYEVAKASSTSPAALHFPLP